MEQGLKKVYCIESEQSCNEICLHFSQYPVLGLDSEWVSYPKEGPISTLQLSTPDGTCAVIRLRKICASMQQNCPTRLRALLANNSILKVGVGMENDVRKLLNDYGLRLSSWLDLRYLARENGVTPKGLDHLALATVGMTLDKDPHVKFGNWDADTLTNDQIHYAALDAFAAVKIFAHFENLEAVKRRRQGLSSSSSSFIQQNCSKYANKRFIWQESDR
uniref:Exonuclease 3'-5' domain-containing protein 2 n=1 Tax=Cacopsylla melanoneura TaxID=428564 RepID=A0A8D8VYY5_9HEMI